MPWAGCRVGSLREGELVWQQRGWCGQRGAGDAKKGGASDAGWGRC